MKNIAEFRTLFESHFTPLVNYAFGITRDKEQAKDIVQSFFIQLWANYQNHQPEKFEAYAFRSVRNRALNFNRDQKKFAEDLSETEGVTIDTLAHDEDFPRYLLESAIRKLPDKCREIFLLSKLEGLTYAEIAESLGLSVKTVENQIRIGLEKLRIILAPYREHFTDKLTELS